MAEFINDKLDLKYSSTFDMHGMHEESVNLILNPVTNEKTTLTGTVTDGTNPIKNATVKVFDSNGVPYMHTLTDDSGNYLFEGLPVGTYNIAVACEGYRMSPFQGASLTKNATSIHDFTLIRDETLSLGAISGIVSKLSIKGENENLGSVKLTLFDTDKNIVAVTYSADDGEFAFYDIADGKYTVVGTLNGYLESAGISLVISDGSISNILITMTIDTRVFNGTVNGVITDNNGNIVSGCFVGLYHITTIDGVRKETLVSITKTNYYGQYLFGNVGGGTYIVKAKLNA